MQFCTKCLNVSTRPRLTFNEKGICSACKWDELKKSTVDWKSRWNKLEELCDKYRIKDQSNWDVIVPCSGGKDGSYVAWKMKHDLGMHPLCVTLTPQLEMEIGRQNLESFKKSGFNHVTVSPDYQIYRRLAIKGLKEQGQPRLPFIGAVPPVIMKISMKFHIPFVIFGEEGESEYGGVMTQAENPKIQRESIIKYYFSGYDNTEYLDEFTREELRFWLLPSEEELEKSGYFATHWSHYEDWDPYKHYLLAKKYCGYQTLPERSIGTYTNFAQLDDYLQSLHAYLMFLKFGFGRTTSDVCIDIRRGALDRKQALELVKKYDEEYPNALIPLYLEYFKMTKEEFDSVLDRFANRDLLKKVNGIWKKNFVPQ